MDVLRSEKYKSEISKLLNRINKTLDTKQQMTMTPEAKLVDVIQMGHKKKKDDKQSLSNL